MNKIQNILAIKMAFLFVVFCNAFVDVSPDFIKWVTQYKYQ